MRKTWVVVIILFFCACRGEKWDDKLTLPRQNYIGDQLKIEGYYYSDDGTSREVLIYYRNGVYISGIYFPLSDIGEMEEQFSSGTFYNNIKERKERWGRFIISGNELTQESWATSTGGGLPVYTTEAIILNDSTLKLVATYRSCKPRKKTEYEQYFYFKKFSPKPDSTNSYTN